MKDKVKRLILAQFVQRGYDDYTFIGAFIDTRLSMIRRVIDAYPVEIATELANELCRVHCLPEMVERKVEDFRQNIRALVRGLWTGDLSEFDFIDGMQLAINFQLSNAWYAGAKECGILPTELTQEEQDKKTDFINGQFPYIPGFADAITENSKANGGKLGPLFDRAELWINRYNEAQALGAAMACADEKREWAISYSKKNCQSCLKLNGRVKRYSFWLTHVMPQGGPNDKLQCKGWQCGCTLQPTDKRVSKGPLPRLP